MPRVRSTTYDLHREEICLAKDRDKKQRAIRSFVRYISNGFLNHLYHLSTCLVSTRLFWSLFSSVWQPNVSVSGGKEDFSLKLNCLSNTRVLIDSCKVSAKTHSAKKSADQRRHKRQNEEPSTTADIANYAAAAPCDDDDASSCDDSANDGSAITTPFRGIQETNLRFNMCVNGLSDKENLIGAKMCHAPACLLGDLGFTAFSHGHLTPVQLVQAGLMPVVDIDLSMLIRAKYVIKISGHNILTTHGI